MKRKPLYFVLGFFILLLSFPFFNSKTAYAGIQDCSDAVGKNVNFEFSPFPATTADNSIRLKLSGLAEGKYQLWKEVGGNEKWSFETSSGTYEIPDPIFQRENNLHEGDTVMVRLYQQHQSGALYPRCSDSITVIASDSPPPENSNCTIKMGLSTQDGNPGELKPDVPIYFHVEGDIGDDPNARRGVAFSDLLSGGDDPNTCKTNEELKKGIQLTNRYGQYYASGSYEIKVFGGCTVFDTLEPNSGLLCPKHSISIDKNGGKEGEPKVIGSSCDPNGEGKDQSCPDNAQNCIKDIHSPYENHYICSEYGAIEKKCNKGECETALGNVPYDPVEFIRRVLSLVMGLAGGIFLIFTIISGYRLMVSQGDPEKVKEAREGLMSALAGLLFIIFSMVILQFITNDVLRLPGF